MLEVWLTSTKSDWCVVFLSILFHIMCGHSSHSVSVLMGQWWSHCNSHQNGERHREFWHVSMSSRHFHMEQTNHCWTPQTATRCNKIIRSAVYVICFVMLLFPLHIVCVEEQGAQQSISTTFIGFLPSTGEHEDESVEETPGSSTKERCDVSIVFVIGIWSQIQWVSQPAANKNKFECGWWIDII